MYRQPLTLTIEHLIFCYVRTALFFVLEKDHRHSHLVPMYNVVVL